MTVNYFAFQGNPDYYRIEEAVINLDVDTWDVHHSNLKPGDKAIIWKSYGRNQTPRRRGIVGFAEILSTPSRRASDNQYWIDSGGTELRRRVDVKYVRPPNLPLWEHDYPILSDLSVSGNQGVVFNVTPDQFEAAIELAGGWPEDRPEYDPTDQMREIQGELEALGEFDPTGVEDARTRIYRQIVLRSGQPAFRQELLDVYEGRCAFTGYDFTGALEACHIVPYQGSDTNHVTNGLLLRADIHTLFDLGKISIRTSDMTLVIADELKEGSYGHLSGKPITLPIDPVARPNVDALNQHRELASL